MKPTDYERVRKGLTVIVLVIMGLAIISANAILGLASLMIGLLVMAILRRRVEGPVADERSLWLVQKASRVAFSLFITILSFVSALITVLGQKFLYLQSVGIIFAYLTCFGLFLYLICYHYFDRFYRGENDEK